MGACSSFWAPGGSVEGTRQIEEYCIVLAGPPNSGKSTIVRSVCANQHPVEYKPTLHIEVGVKTIEINNEAVVTMQLWDTPGDAQVDLSGIVYEKAHAVILVFDVTDPESFQSMSEMLKVAKSTLGPNIPILLCANKSDLDEHYVTSDQLLEFGREHGLCGIVNMAAVKSEGVRDAVKYILREARAKSRVDPSQLVNISIGHVVSGSQSGASLFATPLDESLELERSRGLEGSIPLVVDLALQHLRHTGDATAFHKSDKSDWTRIANYVKFLKVMVEQDKHGAMLEVQTCDDTSVIAEWLLSYLRKLEEPVIPPSVYTAFMKYDNPDQQNSSRQRLRATAAVPSIKTAEKRILKAICDFLHDFPGRNAATEALEPIICGGWDDQVNKNLRDAIGDAAFGPGQDSSSHGLLQMLTTYKEDIIW